MDFIVAGFALSDGGLDILDTLVLKDSIRCQVAMTPFGADCFHVGAYFRLGRASESS